MTTRIRPFLMFEGKAAEAMAFYVGLFPGAEIIEIVRFAANEGGAEGSIKRASFSIGGQILQCFDSAVRHDFSFTPAFSLFVECESEGEIERLSGALSEGGAILMRLGEYGFSRRFTWVNDRYGVSWQLNLP